MKRAIQPLAIVLIVLASVALGLVILRSKPPAPAKEAGHDEHAQGAGGHNHDHGAESRVAMIGAKLKNADLVIAEAGSAKIKTTLRLYGKVSANEEATAHVTARFPGVVKAVKKRLGDAVAKGETLAVVESNDSLRAFDVKSEIAGTVTARDVTLGESVNDQKSMFTVTDLSSVWVDLNVYREDFPQLKVGQKVLVEAGVGDARPVACELSYLSPFGSENTQTMLARAVVPNVGNALRPGLFVHARVVLDESEAAVAVAAAALQTVNNQPVVFVQEGESFEARVVELGQRDSEWVEIISGVLPGEKYAAANSFILKADLGKEGAAHEH